MASRASAHARDDSREAIELARRLARWGDERGWRGTDPYEGLSSSRRVVGPLKRTPLGRRLLIQAVKRSPLDLRPVLGIEPKPDAASVAWAVSALAHDAFLGPNEAEPMLGRALELLEALRSPGYRGALLGIPLRLPVAGLLLWPAASRTRSRPLSPATPCSMRTRRPATCACWTSPRAPGASSGASCH